jgi:PAS domain-containing protein
MTTSSEHAKNATAALHQVLHVSPGDFDVEGAAAVIDQAIRNATRERDIRAGQQLREAQAAAQERLAQLLSACPAVIYSFKATADFAPTFISDNITSVFGYTPAEYLADPSFWRDRVHPGDLARRFEERRIPGGSAGSQDFSLGLRPYLRSVGEMATPPAKSDHDRSSTVCRRHPRSQATPHPSPVSEFAQLRSC